MRRECEQCGAGFEARSSRARFCQDKCRVAANRAKPKQPDAPRLPRSQIATLVEAVEADLDSLGAAGSTNGQLALVLARRIAAERDTDTGTNLVAMLRELQQLLGTVGGALPADAEPTNPLDDLAKRRERRAAV